MPMAEDQIAGLDRRLWDAAAADTCVLLEKVLGRFDRRQPYGSAHGFRCRNLLTVDWQNHWWQNHFVLLVFATNPK